MFTAVTNARSLSTAGWGFQSSPVKVTVLEPNLPIVALGNARAHDQHLWVNDIGMPTYNDGRIAELLLTTARNAGTMTGPGTARSGNASPIRW